MPVEKRRVLERELSLPIAECYRVRESSTLEPSAYDAVFVRFVVLPDVQLEGLSDPQKARHLARWVHELCHLRNRDPLKLALLLFGALATMISSIFLLVQRAEVTGREYQQLVDGFFPTGLILFIPYAVSAMFVFMSLRTFIHQREFAADRASLILMPELYTDFLQSSFELEAFRRPRSILTKLWNQLTHPSFGKRVAETRSTGYSKLLPFVVLPLQIYFGCLFVFFAWIFEDVFVGVWWESSFLSEAINLPELRLVFFAFVFCYLILIGASFAELFQVSKVKPLAAAMCLFLTCLMLFGVDRALMGLVLSEIVPFIYPSSSVAFFLEWSQANSRVLNLPTFILAVAFFVATTWFAPIQRFLPGGFAFLQSANASLFALRIIAFVVSDIEGSLDNGIYTYFFAVVAWLAGEAVIEAVRIVRCYMLGYRPVRLFRV